jgi:hypothetical protein
MKRPSAIVRLVQDTGVRNSMALVVTVCSGVAYIFARIAAHLSNQPTRLPFILEWGPDLFFISLAVIVTVYGITVIRRPPPVSIMRQRFLFIRTPTGHPIQIDEADVSIMSSGEMFLISLGGQIRGPDRKKVMDYFGISFDRSGTSTEMPAQLLVSELTRTDGNFWWPQPQASFRSDGSYEAFGFLGGTGQYSPDDGDLFEVRLLISTKRGGLLGEGDQMDSLDELPPHIFLSNPLIVRTKR